MAVFCFPASVTLGLRFIKTATVHRLYVHVDYFFFKVPVLEGACLTLVRQLSNIYSYVGKGGSEISGKFLNVMLEKAGEYQLHRS
jgi:hypothetical protein